MHTVLQISSEGKYVHPGEHRTSPLKGATHPSGATCLHLKELSFKRHVQWGHLLTFYSVACCPKCGQGLLYVAMDFDGLSSINLHQGLQAEFLPALLSLCRALPWRIAVQVWLLLLLLLRLQLISAAEISVWLTNSLPCGTREVFWSTECLTQSTL